MKKISIEAYELTREEVQKLEEGQRIIVYDPLFLTYREDISGKKCIANYKHVRKDLIYITLSDIKNMKFKEELK